MAHPVSLKHPCGREDSWEQGGEGDSTTLKICPQIAPGAPMVRGLWGHLGTFVSLCHLGMLAVWGLRPPAGACLERADSRCLTLTSA